MKSNSSKSRRLVEALYDLESGKTFVRHPEREDEWLESGLFGQVVKGHPIASVTGRDECEIYSSVPHGHRRVEPKKSMLTLITKGHHSELD